MDEALVIKRKDGQQLTQPDLQTGDMTREEAVKRAKALLPGLRAHVAHACQIVLKAVNQLHAAMGSAAVYSGNPIERQYRNILVGLQHIGVNWSRVASAAYGVHLLRDPGADLPDILLSD